MHHLSRQCQKKERDNDERSENGRHIDTVIVACIILKQWLTHAQHTRVRPLCMMADHFAFGIANTIYCAKLLAVMNQLFDPLKPPQNTINAPLIKVNPCPIETGQHMRVPNRRIAE